MVGKKDENSDKMTVLLLVAMKGTWSVGLLANMMGDSTVATLALQKVGN